jgi:cytidyltransferase-like protein
MKDIVIVSGGFDPLHGGHIKYLRAASKLGDILIVGVNSDEWLIRKKGQFFLPFIQRAAIIESLRMVEAVYSFDDSDNTAIDLLQGVRLLYPKAHLIVANGGDRTPLNNAEAAFEDDNTEFVFGVGGEDKYESSSDLLRRWREYRDH